jgi:hypothetical protein
MPGPELTIGRVMSVEERVPTANAPLDQAIYMAQVDTADGIKQIHAEAVLRRGECVAFVSEQKPQTSPIVPAATVAKYVVPVEDALSTVARVMNVPVTDVPNSYQDYAARGAAHIENRKLSMTPA